MCHYKRLQIKVNVCEFDFLISKVEQEEVRLYVRRNVLLFRTQTETPLDSSKVYKHIKVLSRMQKNYFVSITCSCNTFTVNQSHSCGVVPQQQCVFYITCLCFSTQPCTKDDECCSDQMCAWGQCTVNATRGTEGTICQGQSDCRPDLCCAFQRGELETSSQTAFY